MSIIANRRTVSLLIYFEFHNFFVSAYVDDLTSETEAQETLKNGPQIKVQDGRIMLHVNGRAPREIDDEFEDCGQWADGVDRSIEENYWRAKIGHVNLVRRCPSASEFRLTFFSISEIGPHGRGLLSSGDIGIPETNLRLISKDQHSASAALC